MAITTLQSGLRPSFLHHLCASILYVSSESYSLTSNPMTDFWETFSWQEPAEEVAKKFLSYFIFDDWPGIRTKAFASNTPI